MSRQYQAPSHTSAQKKTPQFTAPPVARPTVQKKKAKSLSQWNPTGPTVDPLARLSATAPIQAKLTVGAANDKYEQEADRVAKNVVQRLHSPTQDAPESIQRDSLDEEGELQTKPVLQRQTAADGGAVSTELESTIKQAKGGGQSLDTSLQAKMGQAMGADFSGVKVHTDSQSDQLNQSIQAKAFTTGSDVFFRKGEYNPSSKGGQELIAHELTHVVQQGSAGIQAQAIQSTASGDTSVQRIFFEGAPLNKHYSHALTAQEVTNDSGVITAVKAGSGPGHTIVYTERLVGGTPENKEVDLTVAGKSGGKSGSTDKSSGGTVKSSSGLGYKDITITKIDAPSSDLKRLQSSSNKKSWVIDGSKIQKALDKADDVKANKAKYSYTLLGVSPFLQNAINCARFGEVMLKAAGIPEASAGKIIKTPAELVKGEDVGHTPDQDFVDEKERQKLAQEQREQQEELNRQRYAGLDDVYKPITFAAGKVIMGSRDETGALTTQFTFRDVPDEGVDSLGATEIEISPFKLIVLKKSGRAKIELRNASTRGSVYVSLDTLFDFNNTPPTLITT
jgi:hypothetical protein